MTNSSTSKGSDGVAWFIAAGNWAAWKFLAVTTGVMAYAMYTDQTSFTGTLFWIGAILSVGLAYLLIDLGLPAMWDWYIRQDSSDAFTKLVLLIILIRSVATLTTSWWASPELSNYTTSRPDTETFAAVLDERKQSEDKRLDLATRQKEQLEGTKAKRIKDAKKEGARIIANSVASGNPSQQNMWRTNPSFYSSLSKSSPYYKQNKAFADRVHAAQEQAAALLRKEEEKTEQAVASFEHVLRGDTTSTIMASAFATDQQEYLATKSRRSNIYRFLDVFAFAAGMLCTTAIAKRKKKLNLEVDERSFMSVIKRAIEHWSTQTLNWFERFLGVDINGDGSIGGEEDTSAQQGTSRHYPPTPDEVREMINDTLSKLLKPGAGIDTSMMQKPDADALSAEHKHSLKAKRKIGFVDYEARHHPDAADTPPSPDDDYGRLRTLADAPSQDVAEVAELYNKMELDQLLREYRSWRRKWTTYNDLKYDQETRDRHRDEAKHYMEVVKWAIKNRGLVPEEVDRLFKKPLVKVEEEG